MIFTLVLKIKCPIKDFFKFKMMAGRCFVVVLFLLLTSDLFKVPQPTGFKRRS